MPNPQDLPCPKLFDPWEELKNRWPEWRVMTAPIENGEIWLRDEKLVLIPAETPALERLSASHVCGHLAMEHPVGTSWFSTDQESEAAWWADLYLGASA